MFWSGLTADQVTANLVRIPMKKAPSFYARAAACLLSTALVVTSPTIASGAADPAAIQDQLNRTAGEYGRLQTQLAITESKIEKLEKDLQQADSVISQKNVLMRERAGYLYKHGGVGTYLEGLLFAPDIRVFLKRLQLLEVMGDKDSKLVEGLRMTQARAGILREELEATQRRQRGLADQLKSKQRQLQAQFKGAQGAAKVGRFGNFDSFTLPIAGPQAFANTWGAPRSGGRRHKGTDVMAPCGASVVAVTNGTIHNLHSGGNGGIMLYLRASNGDVFFYSHLRGYASGTSVGKRVSTGDLIAYNGNTGNARGGPCHVHFEWHPGGGAPVNPYPLLAAVR